MYSNFSQLVFFNCDGMNKHVSETMIIKNFHVLATDFVQKSVGLFFDECF